MLGLCLASVSAFLLFLHSHCLFFSFRLCCRSVALFFLLLSSFSLIFLSTLRSTPIYLSHLPSFTLIYCYMASPCPSFLLAPSPFKRLLGSSFARPPLKMLGEMLLKTVVDLSMRPLSLLAAYCPVLSSLCSLSCAYCKLLQVSKMQSSMLVKLRTLCLNMFNACLRAALLSALWTLPAAACVRCVVLCISIECFREKWAQKHAFYISLLSKTFIKHSSPPVLSVPDRSLDPKVIAAIRRCTQMKRCVV